MSNIMCPVCDNLIDTPMHQLGCTEGGNTALSERLAAVWQAGYTAGNSHAMRLMSDEPGLLHFPNPYRVDRKS